MFLEHFRFARRARAVGAEIDEALSDTTRPIVVAIAVSGGVGDLVVIARFIRDLQATAGPFRFDIYYRHAGTAEWVFANVEGFRSCYSDFLFDRFRKEYAAAIRVSSVAVIYHDCLGRRLRENRNLSAALQAIDRFRGKISIFVDRHPFMDGFLGQAAVYMNRTRADFLHHMADIRFGGSQLDLPLIRDVLTRLDLAGRPYVTVHNGFDPDFIVSGRRATKCYPHTDRLVEILRERRPDLVFVQVGLPSTSVPLASVHVDLVGRTTLTEAATIVGEAQMHIDNEGGLVHIAAAFGVRSCVIFGPTSADYFGYPDNINVRPSFCGGCWWVNDTWMDLCPRGFPDAHCMSLQDPVAIAERILAALPPSDGARGPQ
ncbi:glycosyltransferase family 9 protein [Alsobacter sp. R-9]